MRRRTGTQQAIEDSREYAAQRWIGAQRGVVAQHMDLVLGPGPQWFQD